MRSQREMSTSTPIPPNIPPLVVVQALQTFKPVIRHLGTLSRFEQVPTRPGAVADDPFFNPGSEKVLTYQIYEMIAFAPGISKEHTYPTHFQSIGGGCRCRADGNMGVTGWVEFTVRPKRDSHLSPEVSTPGSFSNNEPEEWELHEALLVEGNSLIMPLIATAIVVSHQGLCAKILEEVIQNYQDGYNYAAEVHTPVVKDE